MEYQILVLLHVILAILIIGPAWIGSLHIIPTAIKTGNQEMVANYFRPIYKSSHILLTLQFLIGFRIGMIYLPIGDWFSFSSSISLSVVLKLALWALYFGWMIAGKRKGLSDPDKVNFAQAQQFFTILSILGWNCNGSIWFKL